MQRIAQGAAESRELNLHHIAAGETDAFAEAEAIGAEEMDVDVAGAAMRFELEMVMLDVAQAVAHFGFAGTDFFVPERFAGALDGDFTGDGIELGVKDDFRAEGTGAQFRACQIQIILFFEYVVGKFVAAGHADAVRVAVGVDDVDSGDFGFFAAIFGVGGNFQRLIVRAQNCAAAFVKPFRRRADLPRLGGRLQFPSETFSCCR